MSYENVTKKYLGLDSGPASVKSVEEKHSEQFLEPAVQRQSHLVATAARAYGASKAKSEEELILDFLPLVHRIVSQVTSYLKPPLSREDLVSAGSIGLIKAAKDYDPFRDADFKTYAYIRVRGAVIDELRSWSFTPSSVNKRIKELESHYQYLQDELGTAPTDEQLAESIGIGLDDLYRLYESSRGQSFLSIHRQQDDGFSLGDTLESDSSDKPSLKLDREEVVAQLTKAIMDLPEKQRQIVVLYYQQELTMKEVAQVLEITESRVSQLHASAIFKLSVKMRQFDDARN